MFLSDIIEANELEPNIFSREKEFFEVQGMNYDKISKRTSFEEPYLNRNVSEKIKKYI